MSRSESYGENNPRSPRVDRKDSDDVYVATATESLRKKKAKTPEHLHPAQKERINKEAQGLVQKGKNRANKDGDYSGKG